MNAPEVPTELAEELELVALAVDAALDIPENRQLEANLLREMRLQTSTITLAAGAGDAFDRPELVAVVVNVVLQRAAGAGSFEDPSEERDSSD